MKPVEGNFNDGTNMNPGGEIPGLTKSQRELIEFLFDSQPGSMRAALSEWIAAAPRYAVFVEKYKDKIRKKLRVTREDGAVTDLYYELQIPFWLLQERRFEVAYEPYFAGKTRGPDYSVTFRTNFTFNIEVTHTRSLQRSLAASAAGETAISYRLIDVLCRKFKQMRANMANLLLVVSPLDVHEALDLTAHIAWIKGKAESGDPQFYARHRYQSTSDFFKYYERLSGILVARPAEALRGELWLNPQAKVKLADPVTAILKRGNAMAGRSG